MKTLCIIPARGGSKRIPRKNIKPFLDKPIMAYSIETALKSGLFDEVMVSTDDPEIASIALKYGAKVPIMRSQPNADDHATLADVLIEVVQQYRDNGFHPETLCCLLPTAVLVTDRMLKQAQQDFSQSDSDALFPVVPFSYPILRALEQTEDSKLRMIWPEYSRSRSQDLKPAYHDAGAFYWIKVATLFEEKTLFTRNCASYILPETAVQDIDTETDWKLAELKHHLIYG